MVECKFCKEPTDMEGTRLCNRCWEAQRSGEGMIRSIGGDVQITFETFALFPWTVQLRDSHNRRTYKGEGQSIEEAMERAVIARDKG